MDDAQGKTKAKGLSFVGTIIIADADSINRKSMRRGKGCEGCIWQFVVACWFNSVDNPDDLCGSATSICGLNGINYRVYLTQPPDPNPDVVGTVCLGGNRPPVQQVNVQQAVQDAMGRLALVGAKPRPAQAAPPLVNLATYFRAEGRTIAIGDVRLGGYVLEITAKPRYRWDFGDGTSLDTTLAGRGYETGDDPRHPPGAAGAIMHWYSSASARTVTLVTTWHASYTFDGDIVDVPDEVTPPAETTSLSVREAKSILYN